MSEIVQLSDLKAYLDLSKTTNDAVLQRILDGAEKFVQRYTRRRFAPTPSLDANGNDTNAAVQKSFTTRGRAVIRIPDMRMTPAPVVTLQGTTLNNNYYDFGDDATEYENEPVTQIRLAPYQWQVAMASFVTVPGLTAQMHDLKITAKWGWYPPPDDIVDAILTIGARRYRERDASYSDTVQMPDGAILSYFRQLPGSVQAILSNYRIPNLALV